MGETKVEILARLRSIESKLDVILTKVGPILPQPAEETIGDIKLAMQITGLAKATFYGLISRREIPSYKKGKRLYFKREELEAWIESGRQKTVQEIRILAK